MQNGGFFNSNNAIISTLLQYQIPLLLLIYYAGDIGDRTFSTTGSMTEPLLRALGIRSYVLREPDQAKEAIKRAQILAEDSKRPVALLLTKEVSGAPTVDRRNLKDWSSGMMKYWSVGFSNPLLRRCNTLSLQSCEI